MTWNPDADCDGVRAEERMRWLMDNKGLSMDDAKRQVTKEFPKSDPNEQGHGFEWRPCRTGDLLPVTAVVAGKTRTDGANYVCRYRNECGKVNLKGHTNTLNNFWCHDNGKSQEGDVLCLLEGFVVSWEHRKKGDSLPDGAVPAGSSKSDGPNYACRNGGGAGKVNLRDGRPTGGLNNFWIHGNWFAREDGDICCVRPGRGGPDPRPDLKPTPSPSAPPQYHHEDHPPASGIWNPGADCHGVRSEERMRWLMDNKGLSMDDAKGQVMQEFPQAFPSSPPWNPNADCNGVRAEERMRWLMDNKGLGMDDAKRQLIKEFPHLAAPTPANRF